MEVFTEEVTYKTLISDGYVKHWTIYDALREIWQNAIDESRRSGIEFFANYDEPNKTLTVANPHSRMHLKSLVLGESEKEGEEFIGQFGEGFKLSLIVLLRAGYDIAIESGQETWIPKFEWNEKFQTNLLSFHVEPHCSYEGVRFTIEGIGKSILEAYKAFNLNLDFYECERSVNGELLLDSELTGKVFVGGLYISSFEDLKYGYNFHPGEIPVDRDRQRLSGFDLKQATAKLISNIDDEQTRNKIARSVIYDEDSDDGEYLYLFMKHNTEFVNQLWEEFTNKYGQGIPVYFSSDRETLKKKYKNANIIHVPMELANMLEGTSQYQERIEQLEVKEEDTPAIRLQRWYEENKDMFPEALRIAYFRDVVEQAKDWRF